MSQANNLLFICRQTIIWFWGHEPKHTSIPVIQRLPAPPLGARYNNYIFCVSYIQKWQKWTRQQQQSRSTPDCIPPSPPLPPALISQERNKVAFLASRVKIPARAPRVRSWYVPREQVVKDTCDRLGVYSGGGGVADGIGGVGSTTSGGFKYEDLEEEERRQQRVVGLAGPSGCGKSTVASLVVAREDVRGYFHDGVVWLPVGGKGAKDRLPELMQRLANMVYDTVLKENGGESSPPPPRKPSVGADRQNGAAYIRGALGWSEKGAGRQRRQWRYLIVADNVYEPEVLEELKGVGACVLYTTTRSASGMRRDNGDIDWLRLEEMPAEEIDTVLRRACGVDSSANLPQHAHDLMKSYGSLVMDIAYVGRWGVINKTTNAEAWEMALNRIFVEGGEGGDQWTRRRWRTAVLFAGLADLGRLNGKEKELYLSLAVLPKGLNFTVSERIDRYQRVIVLLDSQILFHVVRSLTARRPLTAQCLD